MEGKIAAGDGLVTVRWIWDELRHRSARAESYASHYVPLRAMTPEPINDETLQNLWGARVCHNFDLRGSAVSDRGLEHLKGLSQLKCLLLDDTKVTDAGVKKLQQALPKCEIYWNPPTKDERQSPAVPDQPDG